MCVGRERGVGRVCMCVCVGGVDKYKKQYIL